MSITIGDRDIGTTILDQLGGIKRVEIMTGAHSLVKHDTGISMRLKNARAYDRAISGIKISLVNDVYTLEVFKVVKLEYRIVETKTDVFVCNLKRMFTQMTGLDLSL